MGELAVDRRDNGRLIDLRRDPDAVRRLPRGRAGGRYRCCACGAPLLLAGPASDASQFTPRFRHASGRPGRDYCGAPAQQQADVQADLTRVLELRDRLAVAWPGTSVWLQVDPGQLGRSWLLPPALIVERGGETAVVERPRRPLTSACADDRLRVVRAQYGAQVQHWWLFDHDDPVHYDLVGALTVRIRGQEATHLKVHPTPAQRKLAASGAHVYWLTGSRLFIPYGGRSHLHSVHKGEDWSGQMASWRRDWRISHPQPAGDADWWGLVPVPVTAWARHRALRPVTAFTVMTDLAAAEQGRERYRRQQARTHARDHALTGQPSLPAAAPESPAVPTTTPAMNTTGADQPAPQHTTGHDASPAAVPPVPEPRTGRVRAMRTRWRRFLRIRHR